MPTIRQYKVARKIAAALESGENPRSDELLTSVGYSRMTARKKPGVILAGDGVKEALQDLGFSMEGADSVVQKILYKSKREDMKLRAADMVYKRLGSYKDTEQGATKQNILVITEETAKRFNVIPPSNTEDSRS